MGSGRGKMESVRRATRTVLFMVMMLGSLVTSSASVIVAMADVIMPCVILSIFTCCHSCYTLTFEWNTYSFRSSLADVPLLSLFRSFLILCAYYVCDVHCLSNGPYLGITVICALASAVILIIKVSFFTILEALQTSPTAPRSPRFKQSWGMPAMFLSSMVLALGHIVVAYKIRYQSRRMLLLQRLDPEAVLMSKAASHGYQKLVRSPNPRKLGRVDSEGKMHPFYEERDIPAKMLADGDSLFILCEGLVIHYKIINEKSFFGSTIHNFIGDANDRDWCIRSGRQTFDNPSRAVSVSRSVSDNLIDTSLHAPSIDSFTDEGTSTSSCGFDECFPFPQNITHLKLEKHIHDEVDFKSECLNRGNLVTKAGQQKAGLDGIVLIHGFGGGAFAWRNVMTPLARHTGCPVVAFDRPGWGLTSRPQRAEWEEQRLPNPYELRSQVDSLFSFCKKLGLFSVVLVGHDDGGLLSLMAAEKAQTCINASPVEVKGVVLVSVSISREVVPTFARVLLHTSLGRHLVRPLLRTEIIQVANRRSWYDASKLTADILDLYKAPLRVEGWDKAIAEVSKLSIGTMLSASHASDLLKAVQGLPVLVTVGAEDILVSVRSSQILASKISNSKLVAISGCGHLPHEECPKELLSAIVPFVSNLCMELNLSDKFVSDEYR